MSPSVTDFTTTVLALSLENVALAVGESPGDEVSLTMGVLPPPPPPPRPPLLPLHHHSQQQQQPQQQQQQQLLPPHQQLPPPFPILQQQHNHHHLPLVVAAPPLPFLLLLLLLSVSVFVPRADPSAFLLPARSTSRTAPPSLPDLMARLQPVLFLVQTIKVTTRSTKT